MEVEERRKEGGRSTPEQGLNSVKPVSTCISLEIFSIFLLQSSEVCPVTSHSHFTSLTIARKLRSQFWFKKKWDYHWDLKSLWAKVRTGVKSLPFKALRRFFYCSDPGCALGKIKTKNMKRFIFKMQHTLKLIWYQGYFTNILSSPNIARFLFSSWIKSACLVKSKKLTSSVSTTICLVLN